MSGRQDPRMPAPRGAYLQRGQARRPPSRGFPRGGLYQRGSPRGAFGQRAGPRGSNRPRGGPRGARRGPPQPPPEVDQRTLREIATQLWKDVRTWKWWRRFWRRVPARRRCAVCIKVRSGAWAVAVLTAAGGAGGVALLSARAARAEAWAAVYAGRAALLAYLTALAAAALLLLPAAAVLVAGLALQSHALVDAYLWTVTAHVAVDWLATAYMATYCLAEPSCLRGRGARPACNARGEGGGSAFLVPGTVLMLGYSAVWRHLIIAVNSYRHTFESYD